jgi:diguanylate cyclase (GGDEF)-like protein
MPSFPETLQNDTAVLTAEQSTRLLEMQKQILEKVVNGADVQATLDDLCRAAESMLDNTVASIMKYDDTRTSLQVIAGPSLPKEAIESLNGLQPSEQAGSCGTAVFSNQPQFISCTLTDYRWQPEAFQKFALNFNIQACWSVPIRMSDNQVIGSFALSSFENRTPSDFHKMLLETGAHLAGIILKSQEAQQKLWKMAHFDPLTGLPNRNKLLSQIERAIKKAQKNHSRLAVLCLDIDKFKDINDSDGHDSGDNVLKFFAEKITPFLDENDTLARIGSDEFAILLNDIENKESIETLCENLNQSIQQCRPPSLQILSLSACIGISLYPDDATTAKKLLKLADTALYSAKKQHIGSYCFYHQTQTEALNKRLSIQAELKIALSQKQFEVHYQPQFCSKTNKLIGLEALVRWQHPQKGLIPPNDFIPIAEENGLIAEIDEQVLETACRQCLSWWRQGIPKFTLAINLSISELHSGFVKSLQNQLTLLQFPLEQLEMEITESLAMVTSAQNVLNELHQLGFKLAMDDFGTGHSSLAQLKRLPIHCLKIDRSFVTDIPNDTNDMIIAQTIINMGHTLGLKIVAEGVETEQQKNFLIKNGCDYLQGYFFSKPLPADEIESLLCKHQ